MSALQLRCADDVVLKAQKAVARADAKEEAAEDAADAKQVQLERAMKALLKGAPEASSELPIAQFQKATKGDAQARPPQREGAKGVGGRPIRRERC
jgi:hypothetical protein